MNVPMNISTGKLPGKLALKLKNTCAFANRLLSSLQTFTVLTFSSCEIVNQWKFQWLGKMLFAHGTNHSRVVLILFSDELQLEIKNVVEDKEGRFIFVEALIQDSPFLLVNLYAPTKSHEQCFSLTELLVSWKI